jgi:WD40 repeat protein
MIMAISIFQHPGTNNLTVLAGYESGHTTVSQLTSGAWKTLYTAQAHTQPVLSLDISPSKDFYLTSSADAIIAKHPIPVPSDNGNGVVAVESTPLQTLQTKHSGQQGLRIRNDGKVFATAGWDSRVRVYATRGMKELAVLKWHKEGCYAVAFADVEGEKGGEGGSKQEGESEGKELVKKMGTMTVKEERVRMAKMTHWLAAGSKDGKVSLWDIY